MSSADSYTMSGKRVTRIGAIDIDQIHYDPTVHLSMAIKRLAVDASDDESLGFILNAEDAVELGLSLCPLRPLARSSNLSE